ncbi:hypothetical protein TNCV_4932921 [Trichonephila clavipes]|nr:hypothetical protein TNCV_4932921 [Trichonephila clavipes]
MNMELSRAIAARHSAMWSTDSEITSDLKVMYLKPRFRSAKHYNTHERTFSNSSGPNRKHYCASRHNRSFCSISNKILHYYDVKMPPQCRCLYKMIGCGCPSDTTAQRCVYLYPVREHVS